MSFSDPNLTAIDYAERSGNNSVSVLEPLFDQLIKKALTYMFNDWEILYHCDNDFFFANV